jgi:hypothetical protein
MKLGLARNPSPKKHKQPVVIETSGETVDHRKLLLQVCSGFRICQG